MGFGRGEIGLFDDVLGENHVQIGVGLIDAELFLGDHSATIWLKIALGNETCFERDGFLGLLEAGKHAYLIYVVRVVRFGLLIYGLFDDLLGHLHRAYFVYVFAKVVRDRGHHDRLEYAFV
jgi:hypothetical protein